MKESKFFVSVITELLRSCVPVPRFGERHIADAKNPPVPDAHLFNYKKGNALALLHVLHNIYLYTDIFYLLFLRLFCLYMASYLCPHIIQKRLAILYVSIEIIRDKEAVV